MIVNVEMQVKQVIGLVVCIIVDENVDVVCVIICILSLVQQDDFGGLKVILVFYVIDCCNYNGFWQEVFVNNLMNEKCLLLVQIVYCIDLFYGGGFWDIWV